jgi:hypothetical protein
MSWTNYFIWFLVVVLATYAKSQITLYWVPIEFSFFLIFFVLRQSSMNRALMMVMILSLGLDIIFQTGQIKGLSAMGQLVMAYALVKIRDTVIPSYSDLIFTGAFAIFYIGNYYITMLLSGLFGVYHKNTPPVNVIFFAFVHMMIFGVMLVIALKFRKEPVL